MISTAFNMLWLPYQAFIKLNSCNTANMASNTNQSIHQYLDGQFDSQLSRQLVLSVPVTLSKRLLIIHVLSTFQSLRKSEKTADYVVPTTDHYILLVMSIAYNISKLCTQIVNNRYKCFSA